MNAICPKTFSITVTNPTIIPVAYYKLDVLGGGGVALDSGPNGYHSNADAGNPTIVAGKITNAFRWPFGASRQRLATQDIGGKDLTVRFWARVNIDPGFYYSWPIYWGTLQTRLSARGIAVGPPYLGLPPAGAYSEARPYLPTIGGSGVIWSEPTVMASALMDYAWHRVAVRFNKTTNILSIKVDNGADNSAVVANPAALTGSAAFMSGCVGAGAPTDSIETCEIGLYDHYFTDAELLADWAAGAGQTYP